MANGECAWHCAFRFFCGTCVSVRLARVMRVVGFVLALASYWAPWVAHPAAGLSLAEQDLTEFPKFMPQVRQHELFVFRESFYLPLIVLAVALIVWAAYQSPSPAKQGRAGVMRALATALALIVLPAYPFFLSGFQSEEFQTQQLMSVGTLVLLLLTPLIRRVPMRATTIFLFVWLWLGALLPTAQFFWMKPALDEIYHQPVLIGWGVSAGAIGFALLALSQLSLHQSKLRMEHK